MKIFIIILVLLFTSASTGLTMPDDSLVLHLTFDEGAGDIVIDDSIYENSGELMGSPKWVDGKFGKALEFDGGGDSVEIPNSDSLCMTQSITMSMWVKTQGLGEVKQAGIEKGGWEVGEYSIYPVYEGGTVVQFFDLPPACGDAGIRGSGINDDQWHYLVGTWDGETISLYIDGELDTSGNCAGELQKNNKSLHIGSRLGGLEAEPRALNGIVDEVRIYNRALTQDEIKKDMETFGEISVNTSKNLTICWGQVKYKE
jgi:hypothetical protein